MIFNGPGHIEMIRNGLLYDREYSWVEHPMLLRIMKTQTRRVNKGIYLRGRDYAVQRKRGVKAEPDIRIVMERIWKEYSKEYLIAKDVQEYPNEILISEEDAWAEGGYTPEKYEKLFKKLNPNWDGWSRWAFKFYVIEVRK